MVSFSDLISASIEWTGLVLFRPFKLKKWLILTFVALLSGSLVGGGCNFNLPYNTGTKPKQEISKPLKSQTETASVNQADNLTRKGPLKELKSKFSQLYRQKAVFLIIAIGLILLAFFLIITWLSCRLDFIFLEDVIRNDASIKGPFFRNKILGNSLFSFYLVFLTIFLAALAADILLAVHVFQSQNLSSSGFGKAAVALLPFSLLFILLLLLFWIITFMAINFVIPVMFKDRINVMKAWPVVLAIIRSNKLLVFKYFLIRFALGICALFINILLVLAVAFGIIIPLILIMFLVSFIYNSISHALQPFFIVLTALIGLPILLSIWYFTTCLGLPFAVFFRTFSVKFLGKADGRYNLFNFGKEAGPA
ncbi:MAG: hypothetical protein KJ880_04055 [Candidatus Omnitrophica bacterium]|nr:hypothetical protein [Candidatus Omnitrophota bacterium]MBU1870151.1 hypothetical protein [Candidatus Omnitrophota bacterium]